MGAVLADLTYGQIVQVSGRQAVVGVLREAPEGRIPVVFTGGDRQTVLVDAAEVVPVRRTWKPGTVGTCAKCGAVWAVHGDRTSHCSGCCETWEGGTLWDAHRVETATPGRFTCRRAAVMEFRGARLRKVADPVPGLVTVGSWRGPAPKMSAPGYLTRVNSEVTHE